MNKKQNIWLVAVLVCGLGLGVTSCKDDDDKNDKGQISVVTIDNELLKRGVETDARSASIEVPIDCNGTWHATVPADVDWARIEGWQMSYEGKQTLVLNIDANITGAGRSTTLNITNNKGKMQRIALRQLGTADGVAPDNGSGEVWADAGLGTGIDYDYALDLRGIKARAAAAAAKGEKWNSSPPKYTS